MKQLTIALIVLLAASMTFAAERHLLTSTEKSLSTETWDLSGEGWSIAKRTLRGGKQEGVELITVDNGVLQIDLVPTRGMSIFEVRYGEQRLGWDSPVEGLVHPAYVDLESRGGLGWLEGFNEWMVRCGLEFAGHPGTDEFINNTGDTATMDLTLHGKIGNIPASEVEVLIDDEAPQTIRVRGIVYEKFFYGPKLKLTTELVIVPGESRFKLHDTITNLGTFDQEYQIIYHTNYGAPLLEEGARVHVAAKSITPMNAHAAKGIDDYATSVGPTSGFIEQVYLVEPLSNSRGESGAVLVNSAGDFASSISWATKQLPYLTIWKNTAAVEDGYVTGIEPATGYPFNRKVERAAGRVPKLPSGNSQTFSLTFAIHDGEEAVQKAVDSVQSIQGDREVELISEPPKTE